MNTTKVVLNNGIHFYSPESAQEAVERLIAEGEENFMVTEIPEFMSFTQLQWPAIGENKEVVLETQVFFWDDLAGRYKENSCTLYPVGTKVSLRTTQNFGIATINGKSYRY